jgi:hypothetical protein
MFELAQTPRHIPANPSLLDDVHQEILSILELEGKHEGCGTLLLPKLVVTTVVSREIFRSHLFTESCMSEAIQCVK